MRLEILNLNLENSPNSTLEFAEFSQVREIFLLNLSLENSPNSALEFREFSKLILVFEKNVFWILLCLNLSLEKISKLKLNLEIFSKLSTSVWRILQTQKKDLLNLSLENSPNTALEFGEFSKLILVFEKKTCFRNFVYFLNISLEKISKLKVEFGENLQTQSLSVCVFQFCFFFRKKIVWRF